MAKEENFYGELDKKKKHSYCTCQTLAIGMVIFIILVVIGVTLAVKQITAAVKPNRQVTGTQNDTATFQQKVHDLAKMPGASTTLTITEQELTSLLMTAISKQPEIPLRDTQAEIDPREIRLSGTATQFLNTNLTITVIPKVVDGKVLLELVKIQAGNFPVPAVLTEKLSSGFEKLFIEQFEQLKGVTVKSIQLDQGKMTITGSVTGDTGLTQPAQSSAPNPS